jgi:two-component system, chemotaxis family, chemotaxis protein CheY
MEGAARQEGCVVVVDDDPQIRSIVREALEDEGCAVREARNGREALDALRTLVPDVVVLDMRMPVMDGWEFAAAYRTAPGPHAPIVVLTAAADAEQWAAEVAADAYVPKPFQLDDLLVTLSRFSRCITAP